VAFFITGTLAPMDRVVLVARLRPDAHERARELLAEERATASIEGSVDRKAIFMSESEIVFLFEGPESEESLKELFNDPRDRATSATGSHSSTAPCIAPPRCTCGNERPRRGPRS
jgi:hypothetical protein